MTFIPAHYTAALPEIWLASAILIMLLIGALTPPAQAARRVQLLSFITIMGTCGMLLMSYNPFATTWAFPVEKGVMHVLDSLAMYAKGAVLLASAFVIGVSNRFLTHTESRRFEYYLLILLSALGMFIIISANDMLMLYMGLELMSFPFYILAAFNRNNAKSSEAGLKYFVLGSMASGLVLYGISLLYGLTASTDFTLIRDSLSAITMHGQSVGVTVAIAMVLVLAGLTFKLSAVPFHMWTPDVYQGSPTPVTLFLATAPKVAAFVLLLRLLYIPFGSLVASWQPIIIVISIATMATGALLAIMQSNIKRMLAYSAIVHIGFMLVGIAAATEQGVAATLGYLLIYLVMTTGSFAGLLALQNRGIYLETIAEIRGLAKSSPILAFSILIFMFSLAGLPPLAGFFAKFMVFKAALDANMVWLSFAGVMFSVSASYYALRVVKAMYFEEGGKQVDGSLAIPLASVIAVTALGTVLLGLFPHYVTVPAAAAAASLF